MTPLIHLLSAVLAGPTASAQEGVTGSAAAWSVPVPAPVAVVPVVRTGPALPELLEGPAAPYPPGALAEGREAEVLLELDVSAEGEVMAASVLAPVGHGFDDAALLAVQNFRFLPALDADSAPAPSRIQYMYRFTLDMVPTVAVEGTILQSGARAPVEGATVVAKGPGDRLLTTTTGADGTFSFVDLEPGEWLVAASAPGFEAAQTQAAVEEGTAAEVTLFLTGDRPWEAGTAGEEIEVIGYRMTPEVTERRLAADEMRVMAGTGGDIVRAVQNLPGVARTPFNAGQLMVRGTETDASGFYLGGVSIPIVFHFGGLSTVVNADSLEEVIFLPGGYGARYGRSLGGVADLQTTRAPPERTGGYLSVDLYQTSAFQDVAIKDRGGVTLSARRSYIDTLLSPVVNQAELVDIQLPRFWDAQLRYFDQAPLGNTFDAMILLSDDRFTVSQEDPDDSSGSTDSQIIISFQKLWLQWRNPLGDGWMIETTGIVGPDATRAEYLDENDAYEEASRLGLRLEATRPVPEGGVIGWRIGADVELAQQRFSYDLGDLDGFYEFLSGEKGDVQSYAPAFYVEQTQQAGRFRATPGVRVGALGTDDGYLATAVDPRLGGRFDLSSRTAFKGSVGKYSQFPQLREVATGRYDDDDQVYGNDDLTPEWAVTVEGGFEQELLPDLSLSTTVFRMWMFDLIVGHENRFEFSLAPPPPPPYDDGEYANDGTGTVLGAETMLKLETRQTTGWLGLTLSRSMRTKRDGEPELYEYDQPVLATVLVTHQLAGGWRVGGRARYGAGNPYTPVGNHIYDLDSNTWYPVYDDSRSGRLPGYFTLDVRVDKDWPMRRWTLTTYLDLQNATNRKNVELMNWSRDYSTEIPVYGLPIIPAFGLKGAW